jgi:hypothetical protein
MERIADQAGKSMSQTTFDRMLSGKYRSRPKEQTLDALAYLAGVPVKRAYDAAGRKYTSSKFADQLPPDVDELDEDQREALIFAARAFLKTNREIERLRHELRKRDTQESNVSRLRGKDADSEDAGVEQKTGLPDPEHLAAHPDMPLAADQDDEFFSDLGEGSQDGEHP